MAASPLGRAPASLTDGVGADQHQVIKPPWRGRVRGRRRVSLFHGARTAHIPTNPISLQDAYYKQTWVRAWPDGVESHGISVWSLDVRHLPARAAVALGEADGLGRWEEGGLGGMDDGVGGDGVGGDGGAMHGTLVSGGGRCFSMDGRQARSR